MKPVLKTQKDYVVPTLFPTLGAPEEGKHVGS